jgi:hypothetical protein
MKPVDEMCDADAPTLAGPAKQFKKPLSCLLVSTQALLPTTGDRRNREIRMMRNKIRKTSKKTPIVVECARAN